MKYGFFFFISVLAFVACQENEISTFDNESSLFFFRDIYNNNSKGTPQLDSTSYSFFLAGSIQVKYRKTVKFVSAVEYLQAVKETYDQGVGVQNRVFGYLNCDLLILDDLGSEKAGAWADQELFRLIDHRMCEGKPVIVTSNLPIDSLKCDGRISNRLIQMCISIPMPETSIRRIKAKAENDKFLEEVLGA